MRLKTDENLPEDAAELLRASGHDVESVRAEGLGGGTDERVYAACSRERRALLTLDTDFGSIVRYPPEGGPGTVVLRVPRQDRVTVMDAVRRVAPLLDEGSVGGRLWVVDVDRIRVRGGS